MYEELKAVCEEKGVTLVAVSKTKPVEEIMSIYQKGQRIFGENRAQEMAEKYMLMPKDIQWHMIGHLQKNKVKYIAEFVSLIHSVDNEKLLQLIDKEAVKYNKKIDFLLQVKIAEEDSKYGLTFKQSLDIIDIINKGKFPNCTCRGLMGMATFTEDKNQIKDEFSLLQEHFNELKLNRVLDKKSFNILSMGMSGDYDIAIDSGSNMVRVGSLIFGARN
jgi:pyridoxal phosphate enzyme (YggS family)